MATRFEKADEDVMAIIRRMLALYHQPLDLCEVSVECLMAFTIEDETTPAQKPPLSVGGYPVAAKIKIMALADRTAGSADARIIVDGDNWEILSDEERDALIDGTLEQVELSTKIEDGHTIVQKDDLDRPKLKKRRFDHCHGWFDSIVRRHGTASQEWTQWERFEEKRVQLWLPCVEEAACR